MVCLKLTYLSLHKLENSCFLFLGFIQRDPILFMQFKYPIQRVAIGIRHGLAIDENQKLYGWGDGTYGELSENFENNKISYFDNKDIKVHSISAGHRHSVVIDTNGNIY